MYLSLVLCILEDSINPTEVLGIFSQSLKAIAGSVNYIGLDRFLPHRFTTHSHPII